MKPTRAVFGFHAVLARLRAERDEALVGERRRARQRDEIHHRAS